MRALTVMAFAASMALLSQAQVSSFNYNGGIWTEKDDETWICGQCMADRGAAISLSGTSSSSFYTDGSQYAILECQSTFDSDYIGTFKTECNSDCSSCNTTLPVTLGVRIPTSFNFWSSYVLRFSVDQNSSSSDAIPAAMQCCGRMLATTYYAGSSSGCLAADRVGTWYTPVGCQKSNSSYTSGSSASNYFAYTACAGGTNYNSNILCSTTPSTQPAVGDSCTLPSACTGDGEISLVQSAGAIGGDGCSYIDFGSGISLTYSRRAECQEDGSRQCLRIVPGDHYDTTRDYGSGAWSTLSCNAADVTATAAGASAVSAAVATAVAAIVAVLMF